jgi:serpin B
MNSHPYPQLTVLGLLMALQVGCNGAHTTSGASSPAVPEGVLLAKSDVPQDTAPAASPADVQALAAGNRAFAFDLYGELAKDPGNVFFSPYSISEALAMTYAGARTTTASEMQATLHFGADQATLHAAFNATGLALAERKRDGFELQVVNQAWGDKRTRFLPDYLDVLARNYGAGLFLADFMGNPDGTRTVINTWVAEQTSGHIQDLLAPGSIDPTVALVLTNAIYFKSNWSSKFDPKQTQNAVFHAAVGDRRVPMMHQSVVALYGETADYQAVELPYLSSSVRMLVILPASGRLDAAVQQLAGSFDQITAGLFEHTVTLAMPKFSFETTPQIKLALDALGMREAFTSQADFSGLDGQRDLFVRDVVHKAFVAVDETGTEAAATTSVIVGRHAASPGAQLTLDRPFIFLVYDQPTDEILFLGQLNDPG